MCAPISTASVGGDGMGHHLRALPIIPLPLGHRAGGGCWRPAVPPFTERGWQCPCCLPSSCPPPGGQPWRPQHSGEEKEMVPVQSSGLLRPGVAGCLSCKGPAWGTEEQRLKGCSFSNLTSAPCRSFRGSTARLGQSLLTLKSTLLFPKSFRDLVAMAVLVTAQ